MDGRRKAHFKITEIPETIYYINTRIIMYFKRVFTIGITMYNANRNADNDDAFRHVEKTITVVTAVKPLFLHSRNMRCTCS